MNPDPVAISDSADALISMSRRTAETREPLPRDALSVLIAGALVDGWDFHKELELASATVAAMEGLTLGPAGGVSGQRFQEAWEAAQGNREALTDLCSRLNGGFHRYAVMRALDLLEKEA